MENPNGFSNVQASPSRAHMSSLPPKGPSQAVRCGMIHADKEQVDMPRSCSTNFLTEEQPSWLEDLLNEPETPVNKGHRRSSSDPFAYLDANNHNRPEELWLKSVMGGSNRGFQMPPHYFKGQLSSNTKKSSTTCPPPLPNGLSSCKEDVDFKVVGLSRSPLEPDRNQADSASHTSENSSVGSDCSQMKPLILTSAPKIDVKRKQHNARRSHVRKLQYIAELERNVQALQMQEVEVSAQLQFLDQQNLILGMENRALKQHLENLSQEQLIKSLEQEILDRELGRLHYMYHRQNMNHHQQRQRQKQNLVVHRRGRSYDLDSQFAKLNLNPYEVIATSNGFRDFPHRS